MKTLAIVLLAILGAFVTIGGCFALAAFSRYCDRVAVLQGRHQERHNHVGFDENTNNAFEREQYWNLLFGEHRVPGDHPVNLLGDRLAIWPRVLLFASVIWVVGVVAIFG